MNGRLLRYLVIATCLTLRAGSAGAWITLMEGEKGKVEMESRFQFWAVSAGQDDVPAGTVAQTESIEDFSVRRLRLLFRATLPSSLDVYIQLGQDNIGSKILKDDA